jgi:L-lactate dehydrogenase|tara:strand:+ start:298 stop:1218 length:921 start_codon:yes stop_codon:yes gene_type:complete
MKNSIGIIGMGWVGASVAISILNRGICKNLLVNDLNMDIAEGEAMDLNHGSSFYPSAKVKPASIEEMVDCDAIVVTAGRGGGENESRLDLLKDNVRIAKDISEKLEGFKGILVIVSNPVDVLTYYYQKFTGLPKEKVIGTGTFLDTSRLRDMVAARMNIDPKSIHAYVVGEHGDSEVVLWSGADIGGKPIRDWPNWESEFENEIAEKVRKAAYEIIKRKGATNHAIGLVTATLLKWILRNERRIVTVSTVQDEAFGLKDVAISLPSLVSSEGVEDIIEITMNDREKEKFQQSAEVLKKAINEVKDS